MCTTALKPHARRRAVWRQQRVSVLRKEGLSTVIVNANIQVRWNLVLNVQKYYLYT